MVLSQLKGIVDTKMMVLSQLKGITRKRTLEIIPNVYQIANRGANIILIVEEELTLVDTGFLGSSAQVTNFIHSLGRSVEEISLIIITHNHFDHAGGLAELTKLTRAEVAVHQADINDTEGQSPYPRGIRGLLRIPFLATLRQRFLLSPDDVDIPLAGGEVLEPLGGLEVVHTPGHTPGSISLYSPREKLLITGDALGKRRRGLRLPPKMASTDLTQALDSVKKMAELDFDILCFGHGRPLTDGVHTKMQELIEKIKY